MPVSLPPLSSILTLKPEPQTTPALNQIILHDEARDTVGNYLFTPTLRAHAKRIFDCAVHARGHGFWVQAEYGAGKTALLGTVLSLLLWGEEQKVWQVLRDKELRADYEHALSKRKYFPVAFSLKGLGDVRGAAHDSLMRIFEEQIHEAIAQHRPDLIDKVRITSAELAVAWFDHDALPHHKAGVESYLVTTHKQPVADYRSKHGEKKLGQAIVDSGLVAGQLKSKHKERFAHIYQQLAKLGGYDGLVFALDEFRSWQDRHAQHSEAAAEDEDVLETLAHVLPGEGLSILLIVASQGDIPQKLSGGGKGDRFIPLTLLGDKAKSDFGEIVAFRSVEHAAGAATGIKDYYDECRKEYKFIKQANISQEAFAAIFPFQPRVFEILRRITQSSEANNLPTARSAIRIAWQALGEAKLLTKNRLVVVSDLIRSDEMRKALASDLYKGKAQSLEAAIEELGKYELAEEEREQSERLLVTLFLQAISVPENIRDGLTAEEIGEAAWLSDDAVGAKGQAEHLLELLLSNGSPLRKDKKQRGGAEVTVFSYETSALEQKPASVFGPLKKKFKEDHVTQDAKWIESLFWDLSDGITQEIQAELQVNGGLFNEFSPDDQRTAEETKQGVPKRLALPKTISATTKRVHSVAYSGEAIVATQWRLDWGQALDQADVHFRIVYLTGEAASQSSSIQKALKDSRIAVCTLKPLSQDTRDALADLLAAEKMRRDHGNSPALRSYAEERKADAIKAVLKQQSLEFRTGKAITQADYGIPSSEVFSVPAAKTEDLARRLLEKAYDKPLFSPSELKKPLSDAEARRIFSGLFGKEPAKADRDAVTNYGPGLELTKKNAPAELRADDSQAVKRLRDLIKGKTDIPTKELKTALCAPPHALTDWLVQLYIFVLLKQGGWELQLNPASPMQTTDGKPLPGNKLTAHTLGLVDWSAKLDKGLLGSRLLASTQKGWNDVLPYARVLDANLKTAASPDEEQARNASLAGLLKALGEHVGAAENSLGKVAGALGGTVSNDLKTTFARLRAIAAVGDFHEFDVVARENYAQPADFASAHASFEKARRVTEAGVDLMSAVAYLKAACDIEKSVDFERSSLLTLLGFDSLLADPSLIAARLDQFKQWKAKYVHAYRKAHKAFYEQLAQIQKQAEAVAPRVRALAKLNSLAELGPPLPSSLTAAADLAAIEKQTTPCADAAEASVEGEVALCPKCGWTPARALPSELLQRVQAATAAGLTDRLQRFKDAAIHGILQQAEEKGKRPDLATLLQVIQAADAEKLVGVITDDLIEFIRQLLQAQNLVQVEVSAADLLAELGGIEGERIDEAVDKLAKTLRDLLKQAKAQQPAGKRVRLFVKFDRT